MTSLLFAILSLAFGPVSDTITVPAMVSAAKLDARPGQMASPFSSLGMSSLEQNSVKSAKNLSGIVPNLHVPEYGSSMTSTIYLRGLGSRMENPVLGLYVDEIPILDKNAYDFDFLDVESALLLRGPQGTLFGRNAMCGVLALQTTGPSISFPSTLRLEVGSGRSVRASFSAGNAAHALSLGLRYQGGFFENAYTGDFCDPHKGGAVRWKYLIHNDPSSRLEQILSVSFLDEGGFAYGLYRDGVLQDPAYNDEAGYRRLSAVEGMKWHREGEKVRMDLIGSVQVLLDRMRMDQDYTPDPVFTLEQRQHSGAATLEGIFRPGRPREHWHPVTGFFGFVKYNDMAAPVRFKEAGIRELILANANNHIPPEIGYLDIPESSFPVTSDFNIFTWNAAVYHESVFVWGPWRLTGGLRLDASGGWMAYDCQSALSYRFVPTMAAPKAFSSSYTGSLGHSWLELLPKLSVLYDVSEGEGFPGRLQVYASFSKGFRAGGFNTQIFSDILQNRLMNGMMDDLGVHFDTPAVSVGADHTSYRPETAFNYELGLRAAPSGTFRAALSVFWLDCRNQQLTVFPPGKSTGRMMTNAGRSRSVGLEAETDWHPGNYQFHVSYGVTEARFLEYQDGNQDYSGNRVPYSPRQTLYARAARSFFLSGSGRLIPSLTCEGAGDIWWDEANTLRQPLYLTLGARFSYAWEKGEVYFAGMNLTGTQYRTFYFKSIGNEFFQRAKPARAWIGIQLNF